MMNYPYWNLSTAMPINPFVPNPVVPQPMVTQPIQQPIQQLPPQPPAQPTQSPVTPAVPSVWNWKVTDSYQHMLMESVPFDGTPVLFMLKNESVFYIVSMVDGKKMVNGYSFTPLDNVNSGNSEPQLTPEEQTEQRFSKLETSITAISEQLSKLVEGQRNYESNSSTTEKIGTTEIVRQPIG